MIQGIYHFMMVVETLIIVLAKFLKPKMILGFIQLYGARWINSGLELNVSLV